MPNPVNELNIMDYFNRMENEMLAYITQVFGISGRDLETLQKTIETLKDPDNVHLLPSLIDPDKKTDIDIGKAIEKITIYARKIVYNKELNKKPYEHAHRKYSGMLMKLFSKAAYSPEERVNRVFGARILEELKKANRHKKISSKSKPLGLPRLESDV